MWFGVPNTLMGKQTEKEYQVKIPDDAERSALLKTIDGLHKVLDESF